MNLGIELLRDSLYAAIFHLAPRLANVLLFILIGRLSGPAEAGIFTLAATYLLLFTAILAGLDELLVRQVSRRPYDAARYFAGFTLLRLALSLVALAIVFLMARYLFAYDEATAGPILILSLSLLPESLTSVAQSLLLAHRRFGPPAAVLAAVSALKVVGGAAAILSGGSVSAVAWLWFGASAVGAILMLRAGRRLIAPLSASPAQSWELLRKELQTVLAFLALTTLVALETQSDTILLSGFRGETEVGWYGAATTVAYSLLIFSQAYRLAVFPVMVRVAAESADRLRRLYRDSVRFLALLALPIVAGVIIVAPGLVRFVFGSEFGPAVPALRILILSLFLLFLNEPNVRLLLIDDRQRRLFSFLLTSTTANILLNLYLIPRLGIEGAAIARVSSTLILFVFCFQHAFRRHVARGIQGAMLRPALATLLMAAAIYPLREWPLAIPIAAAILVYGIALLLTGSVSRAELRYVYSVLAGRRSTAAPESLSVRK
jgi:O-antigen/teichoic acid export membrane protein